MKIPIWHAVFIVFLICNGCREKRIIGEPPFAKVEFEGNRISIFAQAHYDVKKSYDIDKLPIKIDTVNLSYLLHKIGNPDNVYRDKVNKHDIYEFYLENGKYQLTHYGIGGEDPAYSLEYYPTNLKYHEFFAPKISEYILEHKKGQDEVAVFLMPSDAKDEREANLFALIRGENIEFISF